MLHDALPYTLTPLCTKMNVHRSIQDLLGLFVGCQIKLSRRAVEHCLTPLCTPDSEPTSIPTSGARANPILAHTTLYTNRIKYSQCIQQLGGPLLAVPTVLLSWVQSAATIYGLLGLVYGHEMKQYHLGLSNTSTCSVRSAVVLIISGKEKQRNMYSIICIR